MRPAPPYVNTVSQIRLQITSAYTRYYFKKITIYLLFVVVAILGIKPRASQMLGKLSAMELYLWPFLTLCVFVHMDVDLWGYTCAYVCACMCECAYGGLRLTLSVFLDSPPPYLLAGSPVEPLACCFSQSR